MEEVTGERAGTEQFPGNGNPPLFGRSAARRMEDWANQAPLLHGPPARPTIRDDVSSNSIPREVVEEEVRRQVQLALQGQQQGMKELREENQRLRERLEVTPSRPAPTSSRDPVPGDTIGLTLQMLEYQAVVGPLHTVKLYQKTIGLTLQILEYQAVIGPLHTVKLYQVTIGLTLQILEYQAVIGPFTHSQAVPGDNRAYAADRGVSGGDRAFTRSQAVPEDSRAYTADRGVSGGDRAFVAQSDCTRRQSGLHCRSWSIRR